eukprot:GFYU01012744.1.p1 GENE.GFYU01012744.1~~GFYU01012744.1.p1  ORF type:complete len:363 (-),score=72.70 GFYU01012744.1:577-1611(-)
MASYLALSALRLTSSSAPRVSRIVTTGAFRSYSTAAASTTQPGDVGRERIPPTTIATNVSEEEQNNKYLTADSIEHAAETFIKDGLCVLPGAMGAEWASEAYTKAMSRFNECLQRGKDERGVVMDVGMEHGYAEVVHRAVGRYDMLYRMHEVAFGQNVGLEERHRGQGAMWDSLVTRLLGEDRHLLYTGLLMTQGGAKEQLWHADGPHLFPNIPEFNNRHTGIPILPVHCLNVFIPLVDITLENGATEFCPGTHHATNNLENAWVQDNRHFDGVNYDGPILRMDGVKAGSIVLFDYRVLHRALASMSENPRPILYMTYAKSWFIDAKNFPEKQLFPGETNINKV